MYIYLYLFILSSLKCCFFFFFLAEHKNLVDRQMLALFLYKQ